MCWQRGLENILASKSLLLQAPYTPGYRLCCWWLKAGSAHAFPWAAVQARGHRGLVVLAACRAFLHAVLCGFSTPEGAVHVNPAESDVPPVGSRLILLGRGGE